MPLSSILTVEDTFDEPSKILQEVSVVQSERQKMMMPRIRWWRDDIETLFTQIDGKAKELFLKKMVPAEQCKNII